MHLLEAYKYKEEYYYPRMLISGDQLFITSDKGLFILNTTTLIGEYLKINGFSKKQNSLTLTSNNEILFNSDRFYVFSSTRGLRTLPFKNETKDQNIRIKTLKILPLQSDTLFATYEYNKICKLYIKKDTLHLLHIQQERNKLNTIIKCDNEIWINTKKESHTTNGRKIIYEKNLSDIIKDKNNNKWFSSLENGLLAIYNNNFWAKDDSKKFLKNDYIVSSSNTNEYKIYGTQKGSIYVKNKKNNTYKNYQLPSIAGSVEKIYTLNNNEIIIAPSTGCYLLKPEENKIVTINSDFLTIKGIIIKNKKIFIAQTNCIIRYGTKDSFINESSLLKVLNIKRCYSLSLNSSTNQIFVAFSNGLHELTKDSIFTPVLYNNEVITASSLLYINNKTYATTFNNGLFIIDKNGIRRKSIEDGLLSNKILKIRQINNQLFILEQKNIQIFDIHSEKIIKTIALPTEKSSVIYDVWQEDSLIYLSSNKGLYKLNINNVNDAIIPDNYILAITSDTSVFSPTQSIQLPYSQNNIQFKVISPSFIYPEYTYFKYRILGNNDTTWQQTTTNESNISSAALKPGDYTFEAYAVNFQNTSGKTLRYHFTILKPWWQQWWFITIIFLSLILAVYYMITLRLKAIDKKIALF
jgi:ligand-binding sensor domain-containing protein